MSKHERVQQAIYRALDEINEQLPEERRLAKAPETVLLGESGALDSVGMVSLLVAVEQEIESEFGTELALTDRDEIFDREGPARTIASLAGFASESLGAEADV